MAKITKNRLNSAWMPVSNEDNGKIYNERRALVGKWFDKWTDSQRLLVLEDLLAKSKAKQLEQVIGIVAKRKPVMHDDFTRNFPRVLSVYVFSFLDPRSLCRCAQVCWHWRNLTELDQTWMKKCLRLGWYLLFTPSPYESGLWKRLYIENIVALKNSLPSSTVNVKELESLALMSKTRDSRSSALGSARLKSASQVNRKPPWKGSDPAPKDTWRNNYLENDDEIEKVNKLRKKGLCGAEAEEIQRRARLRVKTGQHSAAAAAAKRASSLTRTKSVTTVTEAHTSVPPLHQTGDRRPTWADTSPGQTPYSLALREDLDPRAAFRQVLVNGSQNKNELSPQRTERSARLPPSVDLFPTKPWKTPTEDNYDSQVY